METYSTARLNTRRQDFFTRAWKTTDWFPLKTDMTAFRRRWDDSFLWPVSGSVAGSESPGQQALAAAPGNSQPVRPAGAEGIVCGRPLRHRQSGVLRRAGGGDAPAESGTLRLGQLRRVCADAFQLAAGGRPPAATSWTGRRFGSGCRNAESTAGCGYWHQRTIPPLRCCRTCSGHSRRGSSGSCCAWPYAPAAGRRSRPPLETAPIGW